MNASAIARSGTCRWSKNCAAEEGNGFMTRLRPGHTLAACFIGYITQAIVVNFAPLLFVTFHSQYDISLTVIGLTITVNFGVQLLVDLLASKLVDKIGYRPCAVAAHLFSGIGLLLLAARSKTRNRS